VFLWSLDECCGKVILGVLVPPVGFWAVGQPALAIVSVLAAFVALAVVLGFSVAGWCSTESVNSLGLIISLILINDRHLTEDLPTLNFRSGTSNPAMRLFSVGKGLFPRGRSMR